MARSFKSSRGRVESEIARALFPKLGMIGNILFVDYQNGSDGNNNGWSIRNPLKTLEYAYSLTKTGNNDVVIVLASATSVAGTSQYVSTELTWAKDLVHLIGIGAARTLNGRARIAHISTFTAAAGTLFTLSGSGCHIEGLTFYDGLSFANRNAMKITGQQNTIEDCSIIGLCGALSAADAGSTSLLMTGAMENTFINCQIGTNTVLRSAANANIRFASGCGRNLFEKVTTRCYTSSAGSLLIDANTASALTRDTIFTGFKGINIPATLETSAVALTVGVSVNSGSSGIIVFDPTLMFTGCTKVASGTPARVLISGPVPTAGTSGLSVVAV